MNIQRRSVPPAITLIVYCFLVLSAQFPALAQFTGVDLDKDGLDDALEQQLIERHRPMYLFDHAKGMTPEMLKG